MVNSEKNIFLEETEVKPNRYATLLLVCLFFGSFICWMMAEIGWFRVDKGAIRIGTIPPMIYVTALLLILLFKRDFFKKKYTKWLVYFGAVFFTVSINTMLYFHTTIMLLFPTFVAMLYRSKRLGVACAAASITATVICPILGYVFGMWDIPLFEELILIATGVETNVAYTAFTVNGIGVLKILLYLVLPRLVMVGCCSLLMFYVINIGCRHVENQVLLDKLSHRDALTGLYNQNYYKSILENQNKSGNVGVIFFDVNGLKKLNDSQGHEMGDLLLSRCAKSLIDVCDGTTTNGFRLGGDEFLLLIEGATKKAIVDKICEWKNSLERVNEENKIENNNIVCSLAYGTAFGRFEKLDDLVREADTLMYENKNSARA